MNPTKQQLETLKGKCYTSIDHSPLCTCNGTGKATIEIKKEFDKIWSAITINPSGSEGAYIQIPKYKVGQMLYQRIRGIEPYELLTEDEFNLLLSAWDTKEEQDEIAKDFIKIKILSETEDKYRVCLG